MRRGIRSLILCFAWLVGACSTLDDVSNTAKEVVKSNQNMESMLGEIRQQGQKLDQMLTLNQAMLDQVKTSNTKMDQTYQQITDSNSMMRDMRDTTHSSDERVGQLVELNRNLDRKTGELVGLNEKVVDGIEEQKLLLIRQTLADLVEIVLDYSKPNHYRVAAARGMYKVLVDKHSFLVSKNVAADFFGTFAGATIEPCRQRLSRAAGDPCLDFFTPGRAEQNLGLDRLERLLRVDQTTRETRKDAAVAAKNLIIDFLVQKAPLTWMRNVEIGSYRTNLVLTLGLRPDYIQLFYQYLVADPKNLQNRKAIDFLKGARLMLYKTMELLGSLERKGELLETHDLEEYRMRLEQFHAIQALPNFYDPNEERLVSQQRNELIRLARKRKLSDEDEKILDQIASSKVLNQRGLLLATRSGAL